jgi:hypothetical protein
LRSCLLLLFLQSPREWKKCMNTGHSSKYSFFSYEFSKMSASDLWSDVEIFRFSAKMV